MNTNTNSDVDEKAGGYNFHALKDTGAYDEVMKPWENSENEFAFSCCTDYEDASIKCMTTVYHKAGSDRLVIKRRTLQTVMKPQGVKASCLMKLCCCLCAPWPCCVGQEAHETLDMVTQSVPIQSIFFVERNVTQKGDVIKPKGCCACLCRSLCCCFVSCCFKKVPDMANYSEISIGYNRSNESDMMKNGDGGLLGGGGHKAKTQDYITLTLDANQSFNLHRYLNDVLDKTAPREDVVVDSGLPR